MARRRSLRRRLARFVAVGAPRRGLLLEAAALLAVSRLALIFIPFPWLARRMGDFVQPADARRRATLTDPHHAALAQEVSWAVTRAARHVPFEAVCLPQAMAARLMLSRRGVKSVMHFGAMLGREKPLDAHAWLDAAGVEVTGYPVAHDFTEIACFV